MNAVIAQHLNISESAIVRCEEWAHVFFAVIKGVGARFVSKKVVRMTELVIVGEYIIPEELRLEDDRVFCCDCNRWEYVSKIKNGVGIRHSSRCDTISAQPKKDTPKPIKKNALKAAADLHRKGGNVDSDTVFEAYESGYLSMSDAMNSDF